MKYILMMNVPGNAPYQIWSWPAADVAAHLAYMKGLTERLEAAGELASVEALAAPDQAKLVRAGDFPITDGVFAESKEFLAGYWIVEVKSAQRAYAIAAEASAAPGPGGVPLNLPIEVREVMTRVPDAPPRADV